MKSPHIAPILALCLSLGHSSLLAGTYTQSFDGFSQGTTDLGDGSSINSNNGAASVQGAGDPYFRLTSNSTGGTSSSYKLLDLDPGKAIASFTLEFDLQIGGSGVFADGAALTFGAIPGGNGGGESGFAVSNGLVIAWDTFANAGEVPSIEIFSNGLSISNTVFDFSTIANQWVPVILHWDNGGLDFTFDGTVLVENLATPGFVPSSGDRFVFSGRTGGSTQNTYLDNLNFQTSLPNLIDTGGPIISEFLADNEDTIEDEDFDSSDWIEIYNGQNAAVNLDGYFLTNDSGNKMLWRIPAVSLGAYGSLIVFASAKDRSVPETPLHTNFTLPKAGGYLALVAPDGETILTEFNFSAQVGDVAFGELGEARTTGYLETPTPGGTNAGLQADGPPAEDVKFDRTGGLFSNSTTLSVLPPVSQTADVRFTEDGTVPTESSPVYTSAFSINESTTIRARVFEAGKLPGEIKSRTLLKLNSDLNSFTSNLPIVVVDSAGIDIDAASDPNSARPFRPVYTVVIDRDPADGLTRLDGTPDFTGRGGMHVRGNSSAGFPKKQYSWETWNNEDEDKDVSLLGMPGESDWILQAPYSDKTLMRNVLVYDLACQFYGNNGGVRTRFVEVFFNTGATISSNDYRGVYVLMERIKRGKDRIDVEKLNERVTDSETITGGYIFKRDKPPYDQPWNTAVENVPLDMRYPSPANTAQFNYLTSYIDEMEAALHGAAFDDPDSGYASYLDVDTFIDSHLFVETFKNIDGYRISTYFSKPQGGKVRALPVWDYNLAVGNANYLEGFDPTGWYYSLTAPVDYYWHPRMFQDVEFELAYWDRFWELRRDQFSTASLMNAIDEIDAELKGSAGMPNAITRNFDKWNILGTEVWPNPSGWESRLTHQSEIDWMKNWLTQRLTWMETQSRGTGGTARPPVFNQYGGEVAGGFQLTMSDPNNWTNAEIFYTTDGSDPRISSSHATTLVGENAPCEVLVPSTINGGSTLAVGDWTNPAAPPNAAEWTSGTQGVGYERSQTNLYDPFFNIDVEADMAGKNETCYIRIPFTISSQAEIDALAELTLKMRYDDSFVAYLNGVEIVREANAPASLTFESGAVDDHPDGDALNYVPFPANAGIAQLQVGDNLLAIHGLNDGSGSSDALWACLLKGSAGAVDSVSPSAQTYSSAITLNGSTDLRARVYDGSKWSPLSGGSFFVNTIPASAANLVISEFNYRPSSPTTAEVAEGFMSRGDFEYIELMNIHPSASVSLEGVSFTDGISFAGFDTSLPISARVLPPGGRVLLVKNEAAFVFRHPQTGAVIAGEFTGSISNEGEQITLLDANAAVIRDFTYDNKSPWPVSAGDGSGYALVLSNPLTNPDHTNPGNWRSSVSPNGSPGGSDSSPFAGDPSADDDGDGQNAFLEYATGTSDGDSSAFSLPALSVSTLEMDGAFAGFLTFEFQTNLSAEGIKYEIEESSDVENWVPSSEFILLSSTNNGDGTAIRRYRSAPPSDPLTGKKFYRLRVIDLP